MAESPTPLYDDEGRGSSGRGAAVLSTKLHIPRPPSSFIDRPRLSELLDKLHPGTVALVSAPAGCGKSLLVADWCRRLESSVAWLSLDTGDNDPIRFWRHVAASLDRSRGDDSSLMRVEVDRLIQRSTNPPLDELATGVLNGIDSEFDDLVLVLDDYHLIEHGEVHAGVGMLLEHSPETLRVVIITRADPPLSLARRRARGELTEIREVDLRFNSDEATGFLHGATSGGLSQDAVSTLVRRTEGWAVGLQLAALSLDGRNDVSSFLESFSGSHRYVLDYLAEEVLDRQPARVREFLLSTSVLTRLSGALCDAVTEGADGQELLEACERTNLFLIPLDDERQWWRYHHLFGDLLRLRLGQAYPDRVPELHHRAAAWYEDQGFVDQAIDHAVAAHDVEWAVELLERYADELLFRREGATLRRHMADLPTGATHRLLLAQARNAAYGGLLTEADSLLEAAARARAQSAEASQSFEPSVDPTVSPLAQVDHMTALVETFVAHLRGEVDTVTGIANRVLAEIVDTATTIGLIAQWYLGVGPWLKGAVVEAEPALLANIDGWEALGDPGRGALTSHRLGQVHQSKGDLDAVEATYSRALSMASGGMAVEPPATAVPHVGLAAIAYQRGDVDAARRHVAAGIARGREFVFTQPLSSGLATMALILRANDDHDSAAAAMDEAVEVGPDPEVVDILNPVPVQRAQFYLAAGNDRPALQWIERRGVQLDDEPLHLWEPAHLLLVRLLIHRGEGHRALPLLGRLREAAASDRRLGIVMEVDMLSALALADDDPAQAVSALVRAMTRAAPQRYVRLFVDEGAPMARLLGKVVATPPDGDAHRAVLDHVALLIREFERETSGTTGHARARQQLVVPLTDRELEVLGQLAIGQSNREIADALYVSLNTVKKHVTHILEKLGASNRTAAVDRARSLDLID